MLPGKFLYLAILIQVTYLVNGQDQKNDISNSEVIKSMKNQIDKLENTISHLNESMTLLLEVMLSNTINQKKILNEQIQMQQNQEQLIQKIISTRKHEFLITNENLHPSLVIVGEDEYDEHLNYKKNTNKKLLPENCAEIVKENHEVNGRYVLGIQNSELQPFGAYCGTFFTAGWTFIQIRKDGSTSFAKDWHNYKYGFGDLFGEYWLGLERLHQMTANKKYELWISLESFENGTRDARYSEFSIGSEEEGYKLNVQNYTGNAGDAFSSDNGKKFTTFDNDNDDNYEANIAQLRKGGWWYYTWNYNNLNGEYKPYERKNENAMDPEEYGIYWSEWLEFESLKSVHMAIKPVE